MIGWISTQVQAEMCSVLMWMASKVTLCSLSCHSLSVRRAGRRNCPHVSRRIGLWLSEPERESGAAGPREQSHSTVPGGAEEELHDLTHGQSTHCEHHQLQRRIADPQLHSTTLKDNTSLFTKAGVLQAVMVVPSYGHWSYNSTKKCICLPSKNEFVSSWEQICRIVAFHHLLSNGSSAVNGCRQNESPNITIIHKTLTDGLEWIIVMFLSAVYTLILTAPIHCRGSIVMLNTSLMT